MGNHPRKYAKSGGTCAVLLAVAAMCFVLLRREGDMLFRAQELSLFLCSRHFFETLCIYPGGTLSWLSCLATTAFHSRVETFVMLYLLWGACCMMVVRVFRLCGWWKLLALLLPMALLACMVQTGYWLYCQKLPGHLMVPTLGMSVSLACASIHSRLRKRSPSLAVAWMVVTASIGYPLLGAWSFAGTALMTWPQEWKREEWGTRIALPAALGLLLIALVPQIAYTHFYSQVEQAQLYRAAMPTFGIGNDDYPQYRLPYYAVALSFLPAMLLRLKPESWLTRGWQQAVVALVLTGTGLWGVSRVWYTDGNFHREIRQSRAIEAQDWEGVLRIAREPSATGPTRIMVLNRNVPATRCSTTARATRRPAPRGSYMSRR